MAYPNLKKDAYGGGAWESNPPDELLTRHTGFEVRESHQCPLHLPFFVFLVRKTQIIVITVDLKNNILLYCWQKSKE